MKQFDSCNEAVKAIPGMTEGELLHAMNYEVATSRRPSLIHRMHTRYTKLRQAREEAAMLEGQLLL